MATGAVPTLSKRFHSFYNGRINVAIQDGGPGISQSP